MKTLQVKNVLILVSFLFTVVSLPAAVMNTVDTTVTESPAEFPGGPEALVQFVNDQLSYSTDARESGVEGTVVVRFDVMEDGSLQNIQIVKGLGYGLNQEAIRVVKAMPKWIPAYKNGSPVKTRFFIPFRFELTTF